MVRLLLVLFLIFNLGGIGFTEEEFNSEIPQNGDNPINFPTVQTTNNDVLNRVLFNYHQGLQLQVTNSSTLTVNPGEVACNSNTGSSTGQTVVYRRNPSSTNATTANLDTGASFTSSTTYYVYANCDASATTFTVTLSLNSTTPSGVTNYKLLGTFFVDVSGNIQSTMGTYSTGTVYQNTLSTKIIVEGAINCSNASFANFYIGPTNSLSIASTGCSITNGTATINVPFAVVVPVGWYWELTAGAITQVYQI